MGESELMVVSAADRTDAQSWADRNANGRQVKVGTGPWPFKGAPTDAQIVWVSKGDTIPESVMAELTARQNAGLKARIVVDL